jgi:hypothetical protein
VQSSDRLLRVRGGKDVYRPSRARLRAITRAVRAGRQPSLTVIATVLDRDGNATSVEASLRVTR